MLEIWSRRDLLKVTRGDRLAVRAWAIAFDLFDVQYLLLYLKLSIS
ncbi:MAG: hypothetical protein F6K58_17415 [Symploca sp. SIO2E9]|nr:hypothetical protein [Symploca sp. SIO2E9]